MLKLPFAALNLTRNPFGEFTNDEKAELAVVDVERFIPLLKIPGFALQILGEQGRGKSTHLHAIRKQFKDAPYIYYPEDGPKPKVPQARTLFLDEMQRFTKRERIQIFNRPASFVIASHMNHGMEFHKANLDHHSITLRNMDAERLGKILSKRIEACRRADGEVPYFETSTLNQLINHFGDDLRSTEEFLYQIFQKLNRPEAIKLDRSLRHEYAK